MLRVVGKVISVALKLAGVTVLGVYMMGVFGFIAKHELEINRLKADEEQAIKVANELYAKIYNLEQRLANNSYEVHNSAYNNSEDVDYSSCFHIVK